MSNRRWSGRTLAARRAAAASDMMQPRHGLPWWAGGRSTQRWAPEMSREGDMMRGSFRSILIPALASRGFRGKRTAFRRLGPDYLDLLSIQYWKYGGSFVLEFGRTVRGDFQTSWGPTIPEDELDVSHLPPPRRARLEDRDPLPDDIFHGFKFEGFGSNPIPYDALARRVAELVPQVDAWLIRGIAGRNIAPFLAG